MRMKTSSITIYTWYRASVHPFFSLFQSAMADRLRDVIANARANKRCITVPGCHDAMSAVLIQRAGFEIAFMSPGALDS